MVYRTSSCAGFLAKALVGLAITVGVFLVPRLCFAQGALPVSWMYSPILYVQSVAISPDGSLLATGGTGGIQILTNSTGAVNCLATTAACVMSVAFSPDGKTLADGGLYYNASKSEYVGVVELWSVSSGSLISSFKTSATGISSVSFSPDGKTLADGGNNYESNSGLSYGVLELWNISTGALNAKLSTSASCSVNSVSFSPDGKTLADGGYNDEAGVLELWNVPSSRLITSVDVGATNSVSSVAFSPGGTMLADAGSWARGGVVELRSAPAGALIESFATAATATVNSAAFSPDGKTLADGGNSYNDAKGTFSGVLELWNIPTGDRVSTLDTAATIVNSVVFFQGGASVADGGDDYNPKVTSHGLAEVWAVSTGTIVKSLDTTAENSVQSVAFSPDGTTLAVGGFGVNSQGNTVGIVDLWNVATGKQVTTLSTAANSGVYSVAFSTDGTMLAVGGQSSNATNGLYDGVLELWRVSNGRLISTLSTKANYSVYAVSFSPDEATLADGGQSLNPSNGAYTGVLELWNISSGALNTKLNGAGATSVDSVAFSPNGKTNADGGTNGSGILELWNVSTDKLITTLSTATYLNSIAFSPDGSTLAAGGFSYDSNTDAYTGVLQLRNVSTGKTVSSPKLVSGTNYVVSVAYSPDGSVLFAGTTTNLQAFSIANNGLLGATAVGWVNTVAASPYGGLLAYGTYGGLLVVAPNPYVASVASVTFNPATVVGGVSATGTVTLSQPAPSVGVVVTLVSGNPSVDVPDSLTVAAGATTATFTIKTVAVGIQTVATLTASHGAVSKSAFLTVDAPSLKSLTLAPATVAGGKSCTGTITISSAAPAGGLVISLSSSQSSATVPTKITIPAGKTSCTFPIQTASVPEKTTVTISAALGSASKAAVLTIS